MTQVQQYKFQLKLCDYIIYRTWENFGGGKFWRIITDESNGEEIFGESAGRSSVISLYYNYWRGKIWRFVHHSPNSPKFSPSKFFPRTVYNINANCITLWYNCIHIYNTYIIRVLKVILCVVLIYWYSPAYCLEFLPAKTRAVTHCLLQVLCSCAHVHTSYIIHCLQFAWAGGAIMEALLALVVMTHFKEHGWRWLLGFSALPLGFLLLILPVRMERFTEQIMYIVFAVSLYQNLHDI